ncbi:hypothetical protein [Massilia orientalis]|uniref:Uncharacterized protein n=1 Tax=Massilia orientalis TaxID=3050128 RepID=A0ACC7MDH5_9BURK|nr:hypothetical protein [Massilia sp. YIM B02787]
MTTPTTTQLAGSVVIFSEIEAMRSGGGFWSNNNGWTVLADATLFTHEERRTFGLPFILATLPDANWLAGSDAERANLAARIKTALIEDGFAVALAPDGRWYSADEQDRDEVTEGEYHTENMAWRDLAESRRHVLEEAGLDPAGAFPAVTSSMQMAMQKKHVSRDAATVLHTVSREGEELELRVCGCGTGAYFEWVDHLGDPVGDVFTEMDFDKVEETLALIDRDIAAPGATL